MIIILKKRLNILILLLAAVLGIIFIYAQNIYMIALIYSLALGLFNAANPVIENMATLSRFSYGKIRIWERLVMRLHLRYQVLFMIMFHQKLCMHSLR